jgi:hypothetical protein
MEPVGSLPCSQEPATRPYSESDVALCRSQLISSRYVFILHFGLWSGLFPWVFTTVVFYALLISPVRATCLAILLMTLMMFNLCLILIMKLLISLINFPRRPLLPPWRLSLRASQRGDLGSHPGQSMWDLWWAVWHWDRFLSESFGFPLLISFHRCSIFSRASSGGCTMGPLAAIVSHRHSVTPSQQ